MTDRWIGLDFRHLLTFQAISEEGSFKAAARALGYTPSAVSQQIAGLERVVGVQLIEREQGRHAIGLTDAGRILLRHVAAIEAHLGAAKADIEALAPGAEDTLKVGAYESVSARLLPELIARLQGAVSADACRDRGGPHGSRPPRIAGAGLARPRLHPAPTSAGPLQGARRSP